MSKLGDILQEEVLAEIRAIEADAASRAEELVVEAQARVSARLESHQRRLEAEARAAARRAGSAAELALSTARMQAKGEVMESVRKRALAALEGMTGREDYGEILEAFAEEALMAMEKADTVAVHPDDEERISRWASGKGLLLGTEPAIRLGVRMSERDGGRSVENTLPERLDRAWTALASEVAKQLWG